MAVRTTSALVEGIIEVDVEGIDLAGFILPANELVTELCTDSGYSDTRLELIERWLSAHFFTVRSMRASEEKAGPFDAKLQSKIDLFLLLSHYGQMAMLLDTAGNLAELMEMLEEGVITPDVTWLGTADPTDI